ncbi:hypothetical protein HY633_02240, partial [Candidatus Uhrbacteria bacterium]|nr:hypothetical protein [Candidatus Uhrbacteria bacterium]
MRITAQGREPDKIVCDVLVVPLFLDAKKPAFSAVDAAMGGLLSRVIAEEKFGGKEGEVAVVRTAGMIGAGKAALLGCGAKPFAPAAARRWGSRAAMAARGSRAKKVALAVPECADAAALAQA